MTSVATGIIAMESGHASPDRTARVVAFALALASQLRRRNAEGAAKGIVTAPRDVTGSTCLS